MRARKLKLMLIAVAGSLLIFGCGESPSSKNTVSGSSSGQSVTMADATSPFLGDYTANLTNGASCSFQIRKDSASGKIFVNFRSSGPSGAINIDQEVSEPWPSQSSGTARKFYFRSGETTIQDWHDGPVKIEFWLGFSNSTQFDPLQSAVFVVDCGFSQSTCPTVVLDSWYNTVVKVK